MPATKKTDSFAEITADQIDTATQMPASGVTAGSYALASITVDARGLVTAASSGTAPVTSVAGKTGAVTLTAADVGSVPSGVLKGSGGAFAAATAGTDYAAPSVNNTGQYGFGTSTLGAAAKVTVNPNVVTDAAAAVQINAGADTNKCLVLQRNSATATANVLETQSQAGGTPLSKITKDGRFAYGNTSLAAGFAAAASGPSDIYCFYGSIDAAGTDQTYTSITGNVRVLLNAASGAISGVFGSVTGSGNTGLFQGAWVGVQGRVTTALGTGGRVLSVVSVQAVVSPTGTGQIDAYYAFQAPALTSSGSTILNAYGLWVGDVTAASTGNYAIYTNAGKVSLGGLLHCRAGFASPVAAKTAAYTLATSDGTVTCNATGGAFAVTLPAATAQAGLRFTVKKTDSSANAVTLTAAGTDKIDGAATYVLGSQYKYVTVQSDGSANWWVIANN